MFRRTPRTTSRPNRDPAPTEIRRRARKQLLENFCAEPVIPPDWLRSTTQLMRRPTHD